MKDDEKDFTSDFTPEELEEFERKFCGTLKPRRLTIEEVEQLKREGRI